MSEKQFCFDGTTIPFNEGETIMQAATRAGHYIPHLCHNPEFTPQGSCKLCTVKVNGRMCASCCQPAVADMQVESETPEIRTYRRRLTQMLFAEGNHFCPFCEKSGNCQLQAVAYYLDMEDYHYTPLNPQREVDASHPDVLIDFNRCILCELCVRASRDVDHKTVFGITGRGLQTRLIINSDSGLLGDTNFSAADRAAHVCPVGAILHKRHAFTTPIGDRLYDQHTISEVGHHQPDE